MGIGARKKILLISSGQPSLNPRLVKEADALSECGYEVTVLYQYWNEWGTRMDTKLLPSKKWKSLRVGGSPHNGLIIYWLSRLLHKLGNKLAENGWLNLFTAQLAIGRGSFLLTYKAGSIPADLYIAHNLAALPAAVLAAKRNQAKCAFDAEDFHRHEMSDEPLNTDVRKKVLIEEKYFPLTDYLSASSPEIAARYRALFPSKKFLLIRNVFPRNVLPFNSDRPEPGKLKLFWFSQSVGLSRGIQDVIRAMRLIENEAVEFTVMGQQNAAVKEELFELIAELKFNHAPVINFDPPIAPDELVRFAASFDIGMATEPGFSINNNLALSNKIFTYLNAGLAIVASDTLAQSNFLAEFPAIGKIYKKGNYQALAEVLKEFIQQKDLLKNTKMASYNLGQEELNWEKESIAFIRNVHTVLTQTQA